MISAEFFAVRNVENFYRKPVRACNSFIVGMGLSEFIPTLYKKRQLVLFEACKKRR